MRSLRVEVTAATMPFNEKIVTSGWPAAPGMASRSARWSREGLMLIGPSSGESG
jgi:hypothetical protein